MIERLLAFAAAALLLAAPAPAWAEEAEDDSTQPPAKTPELVAQGRASFLRNCAFCHGETGAGDGFGAASINPKPRNFATEKFKNGSKPSQIFDTLATGVSGTAMLPFKHLPVEERWSLAYYVAELHAAGNPGKPKKK
jgi:mono/diheme cytochrome c family protein